MHLLKSWCFEYKAFGVLKYWIEMSRLQAAQRTYLRSFPRKNLEGLHKLYSYLEKIR